MSKRQNSRDILYSTYVTIFDQMSTYIKDAPLRRTNIVQKGTYTSVFGLITNQDQ